VAATTPFVIRNARDRALARRYRRKSGRPASPADVRECEINVVIGHVFGASLPDDDFGRDVLYELLNQLALRGASTDEMRDLALDLIPELDDDDSLDVLIKKIGKGRKRHADPIARALGVTYEMRTLLDLRTIGACDMTKRQRDAIQRQKEAFDKRWAREQAGAKPQAQSERRNKPWDLEGISESTYRRRKRAAKNAANDTMTALRQSYSSLFSSTDCCHPGADAPIEPQPDSERDAPAGPPSPHCQASFDQQEPDGLVIELPETYGAVLSQLDLARRRLQAVAAAVARSDDPGSLQHLIVAATSEWRGHHLIDDHHHHHAHLDRLGGSLCRSRTMAFSHPRSTNFEM
jgi:hypothetical protein